MFTIIAGLFQFERDLISERTKEGLKSARVRGRTEGRPSIKQENVTKALKLYDTQNAVAKANGKQLGRPRMNIDAPVSL